MDKLIALKGEDHLVNAGRRDLKVSLDVGLCGGTRIDFGVGVDEGQILSLSL